MSILTEIQGNIRSHKNQAKAKILQRFFKTGPGEYGAGDRFLGLTVPVTRSIVKQYCNEVTLDDLIPLMHSPWHEERLFALLTLVQQYPKSSLQQQKMMYQFYVRHFSQINNWDLVDLSAPHIIGCYLWDHPMSKTARLKKWAHSKHLWTRRISIVSTHFFIRRELFKDTWSVSEWLLQDEHDLIHKAVGWMLREMGKRNMSTLEAFLERYHLNMPRTMLRYAIERLPETKRQAFLKAKKR